MSDQVPQQQQPVLVYPNVVNVQPNSQTLTSSHSKGSFGTSFIVLAVIIVVSAAACFLSRFCNKRGQKKHNEHKQKKGQGGSGGPPCPTFPPQQSRRKEMDMEFGFGARVGPGPVPGRGFGQQQQQQKQGKGTDFEIGFDKKLPRQPKGSHDIEMGFDKRKGAPGNAEMMRGQQPYHHPMNGNNFNGARWSQGQ